MNRSRDQLQIWLSIAKEAALLAGNFLSKRPISAAQISQESGKDIKIAADFKSEEIIFNYLEEKSKFSILFEEKGFIQRNDEQYMWIVDPLDGSFNYLRGMPFFCVSIGLWHKGRPLLGAVYDFNSNEFFSGIAGEGAWVGNTAIRISGVKEKNRAVICTGFPIHADFSESGVKNFIENARLYKKIRMIGSAALSICYVACGRADVYYERNIMLWDVAGAIPIALGAGAELTILETEKKYSYNVCVSNKGLNQLS